MFQKNKSDAPQSQQPPKASSAQTRSPVTQNAKSPLHGGQKPSVGQPPKPRTPMQPQNTPSVSRPSVNQGNTGGANRVPVRTPSMRKGVSAPPPTGKGTGTVYPQINSHAQAPSAKSAPAKPSQNPSGAVKPAANTPAHRAQNGMQKQNPSVANAGKKPPVSQPQKPKEPLITPEGVRAFLFVSLVSLVLYAMVCAIVFGAFYAINKIHFDWNHEITVQLDKGAPKMDSYMTNEETVFRDPGGEAYINLTRIADSLSLSSIGSGKQIKFYKTNDLDSYIILTNRSKDTVINGEQIRLSSPVYISNNSVYVPISLFCHYASGLSVSYDKNERIMTVLYEINEELSTPKRKILKDFQFIVRAPQSVPEMTEKEWFEYVENVET